MKNQQNNEEWEQRFDDEFVFKIHSIDYETWLENNKKELLATPIKVKEFIRQQRQEAYEEYKKQSKNNLIVELVYDEGLGKEIIEEARKQAVREFAEDVGRYLRMDWERVKKWNRSANSYNIEDSLNSLKTALEVYEGK